MRKYIKKVSHRKFIDIWLARLSHLSQLGLLIIAAYGYVYTVLPVYQKSLLDEQIAKKELELKEVQLQLDKSYKLNRNEVLKNFVQVSIYNCTGINKLPENAVDNFKKRLTIKELLAESFNIDMNKCIFTPFYKYQALKDSLRESDYQTLLAHVNSTSEKLNQLKLSYINKFNSFEKEAKNDPALLDNINIEKSFRYKLLNIPNLDLRKDHDLEIQSIKIEQGLADICAEFRRSVSKEIDLLLKINWE
ncbi:hypothetical protein Q9292_01580 [Methylophilus sp. VKM B-3414]|uniref:hypothetical protein n=1 Tax=Methylophilus sp. VKM B-3414 TaxID=3076121 RepID=UPI0028C637F1|nr:hypothetical protein [Methylophilus sp. VKM B-3414]MDT7848285.1 hypothetical protein [Methylophilus sp. VKM B-3414]